MAWYWIVLIVIGALFVLTFATFILNWDMKLVSWVHKKLNKMFDEKEQTQKF